MKTDMSPIDWAMRPLKRYADFSGRAPRPEYWWFWLAYVLLDVIIQILTRISGIFGLLGLVYLGLFIPMIAVAIRRLHDTDRRGWWLLAPLVPYFAAFVIMFPAFMANPTGGLALFAAVGPALILMLIGFVLAIAILIFMVLPGTPGPNRFGADPYNPDNLEQVFA